MRQKVVVTVDCPKCTLFLSCEPWYDAGDRREQPEDFDFDVIDGASACACDGDDLTPEQWDVLCDRVRNAYFEALEKGDEHPYVPGIVYDSRDMEADSIKRRQAARMR